MSIQVQLWDHTESEAITLFKILNTCYPLFPSVKDTDAMTIVQKRLEGFEDSLFFAKYDQEIIGFTCLSKGQALNQPILLGGVLPHMRQQGIGQLLLDKILIYLKNHSYPAIQSSTFASDVLALQFLEKQGFTQVDRVCWSSRPLSDPLPHWAMQKMQSIQNSEIRFINGVELETLRSDWATAWWALQTEVLQDVPSSIPFRKIPFKEWRSYIDPPFTYRENVLFAILGDELIGSLRLGELKDDKMNINHTGVARAYRRQGISVGLKQSAFQLAHSKDALFITTQNHQNNPMLPLNLKLGFTIQDELIELVRTL